MAVDQRLWRLRRHSMNFRFEPSPVRIRVISLGWNLSHNNGILIFTFSSGYLSLLRFCFNLLIYDFQRFPLVYLPIYWAVYYLCFFPYLIQTNVIHLYSLPEALEIQNSGPFWTYFDPGHDRGFPGVPDRFLGLPLPLPDFFLSKI